jgi:hypothetical protein
MVKFYKLDRLSLAGLSILVYYFGVRLKPN